MTDDDALRAAVIANPDADLPRLIYADWLDENDQPERAAFIRDQIEAARCEPFSPAARSALERAEQTLRDYGNDWTRHLSYGDEPRFVRGFIEQITLDAAVFPRIADDLFAHEPIRTVRINRDNSPRSLEPSSLAFLLESSHLRGLKRLELPSLALTPQECDALAASPNASHLRELSLRGNPLSPSWVTDLIAGVHFPHLTSLDVAEVTHIGQAIARGLTKNVHRIFTSLDFTDVMFQSDVLHQTLSAPALRRLEEFHFCWSDHPHTAGPLTHLDLGWILPCKSLRVLNVSGQGLGANGVREIANCNSTTSLRWLGLAGNAIGSEGAAALLASRFLNLFYLDVRRNSIPKRWIQELRKRFPEALVISE